MRRLSPALLTAFAIACTTPSAPVLEDKPLVPSSVERTEAVRSTLEQFLEARWSFDFEATRDLVMSADAAVGPPELPQPPFLPADTPLERALISSWYDHTVRNVEIIGSDTAIATVEVVMPTAASLEQWRAEFGSNLGLFRRVSDDALRQKLVDEEIPKPARRVVEMTYRLRHLDDGWHVQMGWALLAEALEANVDEWTQEFVGSEGWWLEEKQRKAAAEAEERTLLAPVVNLAERLAAVRQYDDAIAIYDDLVLEREVPEFIAERPIALMSQKKRWERIASQVDVVYELGAPTLERRWATFPVRATNEGTQAWRMVVAVVVLEEEGAHDAARLSFGSIAPGESKENSLRLFHSGTAPEIREVELSNVRPMQQSRDGEFTLEPDHDFAWRFEDYRTGGYAGRTETRVQSVARKLHQRLELCENWPETPIDVRVTIGANGSVRQVDVPVEDEAFVGCVTEVFRRGRYTKSESSWTSVVQLFGPGSNPLRSWPGQ